MAFSDEQTRLLKAKLKRRHVKTRAADGEVLSYVEGWHVIAEANRIFGFAGWDRQTLAPHCHWTLQRSGQTVCLYSTRVRVTVRSGETVTIRDGFGTGLGRSAQPEIAHDMAIKSAETDATKRALATFGNAFGLALYDPQQTHVTRSRRRQPEPTEEHPEKEVESVKPELVVASLNGKELGFTDSLAFSQEVLRQAEEMTTIDDLYALWSLNAAAIKTLGADAQGRELVQRIVGALKDRARRLTAQTAQARAITDKSSPIPGAPGSFLLPKEKRIRDRQHLAFVASQPCLICGRHPTQAHHLRFAQTRAMALKVSDEFTVPLCVTHHDQLHRSSDEPAYWDSQGISNPLEHAAKYWALSHQKDKPSLHRAFNPDTEDEFNEPPLRRPAPNIRE